MQRFETKYDLLNAAYQDESLKKGAVLLLQYLVYKSNKKQCFPSVDTIAKALNVCRRTVQYNMRKLEHAGYIIRKARRYNHQQLTNEYVFNFGITDDVPGEMQYASNEKERINQILFNIREYTDAKLCQDNIEAEGGSNIHKAKEIFKIYNMPLSGREKLLLVYLCHKANQQGMAYGMPTEFMKAIGVSGRTLNKLLKALKNKGLILIKRMQQSGSTLLVVKMTGESWNDVSQKGESVQNLQAETADQKRKGTYIIQKSQNSRKSIWKNIWVKCRQMIQTGLHKIRLILRI